MRHDPADRQKQERSPWNFDFSQSSCSIKDIGYLHDEIVDIELDSILNDDRILMDLVSMMRFVSGIGTLCPAWSRQFVLHSMVKLPVEVDESFFATTY